MGKDASNFKIVSSTQGARTPGPATDRPVRTDATACVRVLLAAFGARAPGVVSPPVSSPASFPGESPRVERPTRGPRFPLVRPASCDAGGSSAASAPSQSPAVAVLDDDVRGVTPLVVLLELVALYAMCLALLLLSGCAPTPELKTARPGIDRASGTAQTLQSQLDTIEYHARELRKGVE